MPEVFNLFREFSSKKSGTQLGKLIANAYNLFRYDPETKTYRSLPYTYKIKIGRENDPAVFDQVSLQVQNGKGAGIMTAHYKGFHERQFMRGDDKSVSVLSGDSQPRPINRNDRELLETAAADMTRHLEAEAYSRSITHMAALWISAHFDQAHTVDDDGDLIYDIPLQYQPDGAIIVSSPSSGKFVGCEARLNPSDSNAQPTVTLAYELRSKNSGYDPSQQTTHFLTVEPAQDDETIGFAALRRYPVMVETIAVRRHGPLTLKLEDTAESHTDRFGDFDRSMLQDAQERFIRQFPTVSES